jgi:hypothetical protein
VHQVRNYTYFASFENLSQKNVYTDSVCTEKLEVLTTKTFVTISQHAVLPEP